MTSVLVTLDGSSQAASILDTVRSFAVPMNADVRLLMVVPPSRASASFGSPGREVTAAAQGLTEPGSASEPQFAETREQAMERERNEAMDMLSKPAAQLREAGLSVESEVVIGDDVAKVIVEAAKAAQVDLIAMATHGRSGILATVMGSVSSEVVRAGVAPVLLVRSHA